MPQPRRTTVTRSSQNGAPDAQITEQEAAVIRSSIGAKEVAPSVRVQSVFQNWREVADVLGDPFETERIALSKLRQMRRDPMLGFALSYTKMPHVRAKWYANAKGTNGPNAQIAAHLDHDLRRIYASLVMQCLNSLDFGFQALAKRFEFRIPSGTFIDTNPDSGEQEERPIWAEGGVEPIAWKTFAPLRPEGVEPVWDNSTGEFFGIEYTPSGTSTGGAGGGGGAPGGVGAQQSSGGSGGSNQEETYKIDLARSLWFTNERDANFGSIFGYPRLGYAYKYWWSYWFRWAIADRAFERKADPSVIVYHPDGEFLDEDTGQSMSHAEYAMLMGERMRSGGVIALPSTVYEDSNGRGTVHEWEIDFTKEAVNFDPFDKSFEYLDVQKLRSMFIPEQAFFEGKGGTSSRNVAAEMGDSFIESQAVLNAQVIEHINRFVIPQWLVANYPEFVANEGGTAEIIVQGFGDEDTEFMAQLITLIGQQETGMREILKLADLKKILADRGTPIVGFAEQNRREEQLIAEQQAAAGPAAGVAPLPGQNVGVIPTATGFSYIQPREVIYLSDTGTDFIENLPGTSHYEDAAIKGFGRQLWIMFRDLYRDDYANAVKAIEDLGEDVTVQKLMEAWGPSQKIPGLVDRALGVMSSMMYRAARLEISKGSKFKGRVDQKEIEEWARTHLSDMLSKTQETTRREVAAFLAGAIEEGEEDLAKAVRQHFSDFPQWRADRTARTEMRDLYNAATLFAAEAAEVGRVQAIDGQVSSTPDETSSERNGRIFSVKDAWKEKEWPNGTLGWRLVPVQLSIERRDDVVPEFDDESNLLTLSNGMTDEAERMVLLRVVDHLLS